MGEGTVTKSSRLKGIEERLHGNASAANLNLNINFMTPKTRATLICVARYAKIPAAATGLWRDLHLFMMPRVMRQIIMIKSTQKP